MYRGLVLAAALVALAGPASADFYIAQNALDKSCSVVERAPDGKKMLKVGERTFESKADALQGIMVAPECKP
jgi:hypothetical protein